MNLAELLVGVRPGRGPPARTIAKATATAVMIGNDLLAMISPPGAARPILAAGSMGQPSDRPVQAYNCLCVPCRMGIDFRHGFEAPANVCHRRRRGHRLEGGASPANCPACIVPSDQRSRGELGIKLFDRSARTPGFDRRRRATAGRLPQHHQPVTSLASERSYSGAPMPVSEVRRDPADDRRRIFSTFCIAMLRVFPKCRSN